MKGAIGAMKKKFSDKDVKTAIAGKSTEAVNIISDEQKTEGLLQKALSTMEKVPGLGKYVDEIKYMCSMVRDYIKKEYTDVKPATIIAVVASLVYLVSPIDIIPDYIPIVGYLDDMAVLAYAIKMTHNEIEAYKLWKNLKVLKQKNIVEESFDEIGNESAEVDDTPDFDDVQIEDERFEQFISNGNDDDDCDASAY
jgi:uncharacterized membrane protein YkvA (DUF1232 family)